MEVILEWLNRTSTRPFRHFLHFKRLCLLGKTLSNERAQRANGKAVSDLIKRVRQIKPKTSALQDRVNTVQDMIRSACDEDGTTGDKLRSAFGQAMTFSELKLQRAIEAWAIEKLQNIGGLLLICGWPAALGAPE